MNQPEFVVTNSITWKLKAVMMAIALFFILGALGIYFSSSGFISGLQDINAANKVLSLSNQTIEGLQTSNEHLEKLLTRKDLQDIQFTFNENQKVVKQTLRTAIDQTHSDTQVKSLLIKSLDSIFLYEDTVNNIFDRYAKSISRDNIRSDIVVAHQFADDAQEFLRKAQINLRHDTDALFVKLYQGRFRPLIVAMTLSAFFFLFVITFGFSIARKIADSVNNLTLATGKVKQGDFSYQSPIIEHNEFGALTDTFNKMVTSLKLGREELDQTLQRIRGLQQITANFSQSLTVDEVLDVAVKECFEPLAVASGSISILLPTGEVEMARKYFKHKDIFENWKKYSIQIDTPVTKAIKTKTPVFLESREAILEQYPFMDDLLRANDIHSFTSIPLMIGNTCFGSINMGFSNENAFREEDKNFLIAIAGQCSQALHRSKLYDDSRKAIQVRDEFLSIASHELKTPLTPLKLQLQMLSRQLQKGTTEITEEKVSKIMQNSDRQLSRLSKLIEDLLDVSRITAGKLKLNLEQLDLTEILKDVLIQYSHHLQDSHNTVEVDADKNVTGQFDQMRIEQVLVNLLTNAVKYAPGKPIKITLKKNHGKATIVVKDQGPGIAKESHERIFKRFERVKDMDNIGGLGLGLYISKQIIEAHQGRIYVESEPGKGSEFIIELPIDS